IIPQPFSSPWALSSPWLSSSSPTMAPPQLSSPWLLLSPWLLSSCARAREVGHADRTRSITAHNETKMKTADTEEPRAHGTSPCQPPPAGDCFAARLRPRKRDGQVGKEREVRWTIVTQNRPGRRRLDEVDARGVSCGYLAAHRRSHGAGALPG